MRARTAIVLCLGLGLTTCSSSHPPGGDGVKGDGVKTGDGSGAGAQGKVGARCDRNEDCTDPPRAECFKDVGGGVVFPGGYCSRVCSVEVDAGTVDCGKEGGCAQVGINGASGTTTMTFCAKACTKESDCRTSEGYGCRIIFFGLGFCAPK
jgi:hypothetical protein